MFNIFTEEFLLQLVLTLPGLLVAITFHEFAHAYVADKLGDDTPRYQGRITLNPLAHLDPVGTFLLVFARFGWGKPVEISPKNFKCKMSTGEALVSVAGPLMNFMLAIVFLLIYGILYKIQINTKLGLILNTMIFYGASINVALGVFNLIPLPPLDGSKILMHYLPYNARNWFIQNQQIFYVVFIIIFVTGTSSYIISPIIGGVFNFLYNIMALIFGLPKMV